MLCVRRGMNSVFTSSVILCSLAFLLPSCMTSKRAEELDQKITQLRIDMGYEVSKVREAALGSVKSTSEDVTRKAQGTKSDVEDVRRQLELTQGALDELQTKFSKYTMSGRTTSVGSDDVAIRISEIEFSLDRMERRLERLIIAPDASKPKGKLPPKLDTTEKAEKALFTAFSQKDIKKTLALSSQILDANPARGLYEVALRYRGEARFATQDYAGSASDFGEFVDKFPSNDKYARALLLAGDSFVYLRKFRLAKSFYTECTRMVPAKEECKVSKDRLAKLPAE